MYSQSCNCLPNKKQYAITNPLHQNMGLLRNITTKSFLKFEDSAPDISLDFKSKVDYCNQDHTMPRTTSIMDFVYSFNTSRCKNKNSTPNYSVSNRIPRNNCEELLTHYDSVSAMPLLSSHLVGGFVGSKSQLGRRPTNGLGVKMWDIIRELFDLVGNSPPGVSSNGFSQKSSEVKQTTGMTETTEKSNFQVNLPNNTASLDEPKQIEPEKCYKQTYADVAKSKLPIRPIIERTFKTVGESDDHRRSNCLSDLNNTKPVIEPTSLRSKSFSSNRDRIASECSADSEDSFIVFEYCEGDDNSIDGDDSDSSDDEGVLGSQINEEVLSECGSGASRTLSLNQPCSPSTKKVRFAEGKSLTQVHPMVTWNYAYREARRGPWEMLARDSERFKCRISNTEAILKPVLDPKHRETVFQKRFAESDS